jgi:UPF0176 protein
VSYRVAAFYQFAALPDFRELREPLRAICAELRLKGSVLLAHEGINGTLAGSAEGIAALVEELQRGALFGGRLDNLELKYSHAAAMPFQRLKIRLKKEIVTLGDTEADPTRQVGTYVDPADWNALIAAEDTLVMRSRWRWAHLLVLSIPASGASGNSRILPRAVSTQRSIGRSRCFALAAFAAKRPAPICSHAVLRRSITSRAASSDISRAFRKQRVAGAANVLYSTTASRSATACGNARWDRIPMSDAKALSDRIDVLEMRLTFQDEAIETLNKTITAQWLKIDALTRQVADLSQRLREAEAHAPGAANEPPPHY